MKVLKILIQLNFTFQKLTGEGLHAKVVCDSSESMAELRREIHFTMMGFCELEYKWPHTTIAK